MRFNEKAAQAALTEKEFLNPLGVLLEKYGVISPEQVEQSGIMQAQMIAIRNTISASLLKQEDAIGVLGHDKNGQLTFSNFAKAPYDYRERLLDVLGITNAQIANALDIVKASKEKKININDGYEIAVPPIGSIHTDLYARYIDNFKKLKKGFLLAQRAVDAAHAIDRIEKGEYNAHSGQRRGFKLWGDETPELEKAIQLCLELNVYERDGYALPDPALAQKSNREVFEAAREAFEQFGEPYLAKAISTIIAGRYGDDALPGADNTPEMP